MSNYSSISRAGRPQPNRPDPIPSSMRGLRASTLDRQRYLDYISMAYQSEQIDYAEFTQRADVATKAITLGELPPLVADLNFDTMRPIRASHLRLWRILRVGRKKLIATLVLIVALIIVLVIVLSGRNTTGAGTTASLPPMTASLPHVSYNRSLTYDNLDFLPPEVIVGSGSTLVTLNSLAVSRNVTMSITADDGNLDVSLPPATNVTLNYLVPGSGTVTLVGGSDARAEDYWARKEGICRWTPIPHGPTLTLNVVIRYTGNLRVS